MPTLHIKRQRATNVDSKQRLRAHIDHLPAEKQREFVTLALQLMAGRTGVPQAPGKGLQPMTTSAQNQLHKGESSP